MQQYDIFLNVSKNAKFFIKYLFLKTIFTSFYVPNQHHLKSATVEVRDPL